MEQWWKDDLEREIEETLTETSSSGISFTTDVTESHQGFNARLPSEKPAPNA
jgi:hypothetical protein